MQVLKTNPVLWEKLEDIGFPYTYYNGIGYDDLPKAYFNVQISCFEDVAVAVTDICEMVACEELEIPLAPYSNEELAVKSIVPGVRLLSQDVCVWNTDFRYAAQEDIEMVETHIQNAEREYALSNMCSSIAKHVEGLEHFHFHLLRHPYVKPTTKKFLSFFKFEMAISLRAFLCFALLLSIKEGPQFVPFIW